MGATRPPRRDQRAGLAAREEPGSRGGGQQVMAKILIADDMLPIRLLLRRVLESAVHTGGGSRGWGHRARDGPVRAALYRDGRPAHARTQRVRCLPGNPCRSVSRRGETHLLSRDVVELRWCTVRADGVLAKPFSPLVLLKTITALLRAPAAMDLSVPARQAPPVRPRSVRCPMPHATSLTGGPPSCGR